MPTDDLEARARRTWEERHRDAFWRMVNGYCRAGGPFGAAKDLGQERRNDAATALDTAVVSFMVEWARQVAGEAARGEGYRCAEIARTEQERARGRDDEGYPDLSGSPDYVAGYREAAKRIEDGICDPRKPYRSRPLPSTGTTTDMPRPGEAWEGLRSLGYVDTATVVRIEGDDVVFRITSEWAGDEGLRRMRGDVWRSSVAAGQLRRASAPSTGEAGPVAGCIRCDVVGPVGTKCGTCGGVLGGPAAHQVEGVGVCGARFSMRPQHVCHLPAGHKRRHSAGGGILWDDDQPAAPPAVQPDEEAVLAEIKANIELATAETDELRKARMIGEPRGYTAAQQPAVRQGGGPCGNVYYSTFFRREFSCDLPATHVGYHGNATFAVQWPPQQSHPSTGRETK